MNAKRELNIPFPGFYESVLSYELDMAEEQLAENYAEEKTFGEHDASVIASALYDVCDYGKTFDTLAGDYARAFADALDTAAGWPLRLKFREMISPREYNFTTDRVFMSVPRATVRRMFKEVHADKLFQVSRDRHTSGPGFISFYSPDWHTWGPLDNWDANQLGTLLRAWMLSRDIEDPKEEILEDFSGNGVFDNALSFTEDALRAKLAEKVAA